LDMHPPTLKDIFAARQRVYRTLQPTPLLRHPLLAQETGLDVYVKHENHNPTGAFKVRGGLNLLRSPGRASAAARASSAFRRKAPMRSLDLGAGPHALSARRPRHLRRAWRPV